MLLNEAFTVDYEDLQSIAIPADPHGIAHERGTAALYVADTASGAVLRVTNEPAQHLATITTGAGSRLGGLALAADGTIFVTRLGDGHSGAVFRVGVDGAVVALAKLPPELWRLGIAYDAGEHALYTTQFLMSKFGAHEGSVVAIDLRTGEPSTIIDGFHQPVGIAKLGRTLVVADARMRAVFRIELVAGRAVSRYQLAAMVDRPDSVCPCGDDAVLVTGYDAATQRGTLHQVWLDGRVRLIATGIWQPHGVATDGTQVFVAAQRRILKFEL